MILYGKPGIGKTTIALAIVNELGLRYRSLNAVINNNENGILTQVGNVEEMCEAMKKIASDNDFSDKLSHNAAQIRYDLSLINTAKKWMELL